MAKFRGVIIGCGAIAREHLAALAEIDDVEVVAVCDLSAAKAEATADRYGVGKWYTDYEKLIAEQKPDLVHITTPPSVHFPIARTCLAAGLNVFCEKPITIDYQDFVVLKKLAVEKRCALIENHGIRFQSSAKRIQSLINSGAFGDVLEIQILLALNLFGSGSSYVDENVPHFSLVLRGGVIGDFLTHIASLTRLFVGPVVELRTIWTKHMANSPLLADEFSGMVKGERATAYVKFSGNAQPNGFWLRVIGSKMHAETNLFEPPRFAVRRFRAGEPALMSLVDGIAEARDILLSTVAGFGRKLAGTNRYDGFRDFIAESYRSLEQPEAAPISLDEIDEVARLVDDFTKPELKL